MIPHTIRAARIGARGPAGFGARFGARLAAGFAAGLAAGLGACLIFPAPSMAAAEAACAADERHAMPRLLSEADVVFIGRLTEVGTRPLLGGADDAPVLSFVVEHAFGDADEAGWTAALRRIGAEAALDAADFTALVGRSFLVPLKRPFALEAAPARLGVARANGAAEAARGEAGFAALARRHVAGPDGAALPEIWTGPCLEPPIFAFDAATPPQ